MKRQPLNVEAGYMERALDLIPTSTSIQIINYSTDVDPLQNDLMIKQHSSLFGGLHRALEFIRTDCPAQVPCTPHLVCDLMTLSLMILRK